MTKIVDTVTEYENQALETLTRAQRRTVEAVEGAVERVDDVLPADRPELPAEVPTLAELVDSQFGFAKKLLARQEKFAKDLVKALAPLTLPREDTAPKAVKNAA